MKVIGHKGAGSVAPENTRASLERAIKMGVDGVEIDIWPTADRQFVVFHDADLLRLTGRSGWTMSLTSNEIHDIEIGSRFSPEFTGEHVLLLEEALEIISSRVELFLEVKRTRHDLPHYGWLEDRLLEILEKYHAFPWTLVISFDHRTTAELRRRDGKVRLGMLYAGEWLKLWEEVEALSPEALLPHWAQTTSSLIDAAHRKGIEVYPWVVNHDEWMEKFMHMGVDGIITDHPDRLLKLARSTQKMKTNFGGKR